MSCRKEGNNRKALFEGFDRCFDTVNLGDKGAQKSECGCV